MEISRDKIDKLLELFSSSEDDELDALTDENDCEECYDGLTTDINKKSKDEEESKIKYEEIAPPLTELKHKIDETIRKCKSFVENKKSKKIAELKLEKTIGDDIKVVELVNNPIEIKDDDDIDVNNESIDEYSNDNEDNYDESTNSEDQRSFIRMRSTKCKKNSVEKEDNILKIPTKKQRKRTINSKPQNNSDSFINLEEEKTLVKNQGRRKHDPVGNKRARTRKNRPKVDRNLRCKECNIKMKNEQLFIFHMQIHEGRKETDCTICNEDYETLNALQEHYAKYDKIKTDEHFIKLRPFPCHLCNLRYKSRNYLLDHLDIHAGQKKFLCPICGKQFFKRFSLKVHLRYHTKSYHSCERCKLDLQFRNPKEYIAHMRIVHGENTFNCPICNREFSRKHDMHKHKETHNREPNFCSQCNISFEFRRQFNQHMKEVHNRIKKFPCNVCGKVFLMHCKLTRHFETHNKVKQNCDVCGKDFRSRRDYNAHMRSIHGVISMDDKGQSKNIIDNKNKVKNLTQKFNGDLSFIENSQITEQQNQQQSTLLSNEKQYQQEIKLELKQQWDLE